MRKITVLIMFLVLSVSILAEIVYIALTGKKYHPSKNCPELSRAKQIISIEQAEAISYTPCKKGY